MKPSSMLLAFLAGSNSTIPASPNANTTSPTISNNITLTSKTFQHVPCDREISVGCPRYSYSTPSLPNITTTTTLTTFTTVTATPSLLYSNSTPSTTNVSTKTILTAFTTIIVTPAAKVEDRDVAEAEAAEADQKGDDNCISTSFTKSGNGVVTYTKTFFQGCKTKPTGKGVVQAVGFHG